MAGWTSLSRYFAVASGGALRLDLNKGLKLCFVIVARPLIPPSCEAVDWTRSGLVD
jgi:hypothetical protein